MKKARRTWAVGAALCFSFLSSCQKEKPAGNDAADGPGQASITKKALAFRAGGTGSGETLFVSRGPQETGIAPVVTPDPNHPFAYFYGSGMGAGGVAVGDFDNDGRLDLAIAQSGTTASQDDGYDNTVVLGEQMSAMLSDPIRTWMPAASISNTRGMLLYVGVPSGRS